MNKSPCGNSCLIHDCSFQSPHGVPLAEKDETSLDGGVMAMQGLARKWFRVMEEGLVTQLAREGRPGSGGPGSLGEGEGPCGWETGRSGVRI